MTPSDHPTARCDLELVTGRVLRVNGEYDPLRRWLKNDGITLPALHFATPSGVVTIQRSAVVSVAPAQEGLDA